jgi:hypothetical protein
MFRACRWWWSYLWPCSLDTAALQPPAPPPPPPPDPPAWATAPTVIFKPLLTLGQRTGYRVDRRGGDRG